MGVTEAPSGRRKSDYQVANAEGDESGTEHSAEEAPSRQISFSAFVVSRPQWWQRIVFAIAMYNLGIVPFRFCGDVAVGLPAAIVDLLLDCFMAFDFLCNLMLPLPMTQTETSAALAAAAAASLIAATAGTELSTVKTEPLPPQFPTLSDKRAHAGRTVRQVGTRWISRNLQNRLAIAELCALMPLDIIGLVLSRTSVHPAFRLNKLFFRIARIKTYISALERELSVSRQLVSFVHITLMILVAVHLLGCLWMLVIRLDRVMDDDRESKETWYWTQQPGITEANPGVRYLTGFYWALTMVTGYGSIIPQTDLQVAFSLVTVILGVSGNVTVIGTLGSLVQNLDSSKTAFRQKMDSISDYMTYRRISHEMRTRVSDYYNYLWHSRRGLDEGKLIQELPHYLQEEVSLFINKEIISKVPLFHECDEQFKSAVVVKLIPVTLLPDSYIVRKGEVGREMYFISRGEVQVVSDAREKKDRTVYATLRDGSFFGEVALLLNDSRRTATVVSSQFCDLFVLRKEDFDLIRETFPQQSKTIAKAAHKRYKLQQENEAEDD